MITTQLDSFGSVQSVCDNYQDTDTYITTLGSGRGSEGAGHQGAGHQAVRRQGTRGQGTRQ